jgi:predicted negative regulator of RcsB-dependent stress response
VAEQHDEPESSSGPGKPGAETEPDEQLESEAGSAESASASTEARGDALAKPKKKKKRAALGPDTPEPIRDRNRRLREEAAGKRRTKLDERRAPTRNLEAGEIVDDALARSTQAAGEWLKKNFNVLQWVILAGLVGWIGYAIYSYRAARAAEKASAQLTAAIRAEDARIGSDDSKPDPQTGIVDTRAAYATSADRLHAAEAQYRAIANGAESTASTFAKLGLASVLYDEGKYADAKAAYQSVKDSKLATQDADVKGRALEGVGMSLESSGDKDAAEKAFGELSNLDELGFGALGNYHQARIAYAANNPEKAKQLLKDAQKKLDAVDSSEDKKTLGAPSGYLQESIKDLLKQIDPTAVTASPNALTAEQIQELQDQMGSPGGDGKGAMSSAKLQELLKQMSKTGKVPAAPAPPASAP